MENRLGWIRCLLYLLVLIAMLFVLAEQGNAQNVRFDGVASTSGGFAAPGAKIAVCSQPAVTVDGDGLAQLPCSPRVPLCSSLTDVVCIQPNPVTADALGNYYFYVASGTYTFQFYGSGITPRVQPDQTIGGGVPAPGTAGQQFTVNPTATAAGWQTKPVIDIRDWGATCAANLSTMAADTTAINAAIASVANTGGTVLVPLACPVTNIIMHNVTNVWLEGTQRGGANSAVTAGAPGFLYCGAPGGILIDAVNTISSGIRDIQLSGGSVACDGSIKGGALTLVNFDRNVGIGALNSSDFRITDTGFKVCEQGACNTANFTGVYISHLSTDNAEFMNIENSTFYGGTGSGAYAIRIGASANPKNTKSFRNTVYQGGVVASLGGNINMSEDNFLSCEANPALSLSSASDPMAIDGTIAECDTQFAVYGQGNYPFSFHNINVDQNSNWLSSNKFRFEDSGNGTISMFDGIHFDNNALSHAQYTFGATNAAHASTAHFSNIGWPNWGNNIASPSPDSPNLVHSLKTYGYVTGSAQGFFFAGTPAGSVDQPNGAYEFLTSTGLMRHGMGYCETNTSSGVQSATGRNWTNTQTPCTVGSLYYGDATLEDDSVGSPNAPWWTYVGAAGANTYFFRITPLDAGGRQTPSSSYASCAGAAAPSVGTYCKLDWAPVTGAASYDVVVFCSGANWQLATNTAATTYNYTAASACAGPYYSFSTYNATSKGIFRFPLGLKSYYGGTWNWYSDAGSTLKASINGTSGAIIGALYGTLANCTSAAAPAVCAAAAAGSVVVAAAATTVTVNTTAVTANSQIHLTRDNSLGTKLSVTCNTQSSLVLGTPYVSARVAGTSFTITLDVAPTTNPMCISYSIVN